MGNVISLVDEQGNLFGEDTSVSEESNLSRKQLGRYAEFMVCAELSKLGYSVWHCDAPGFDAVLVTEDRSFRIQVRATTNIDNGYCSWMCRKGYGNRDESGFLKTRSLNRTDTDLIGLYHLIFGTLIFVTTDELPAGGSLKLPVSQVRDHDCSKSLERALERFR